MITDQQWDEMRISAQYRLQMLRDEIREVRQGNRADALQGVRDAFGQGPTESIGPNGEEINAVPNIPSQAVGGEDLGAPAIPPGQQAYPDTGP